MFEFGLGPGPGYSAHTDFSIPGWHTPGSWAFHTLHSNPYIRPLTRPPERGSIIPRPYGELGWATYWSRDPATGASLFNANDPILAGSRYDPSGFNVPFVPSAELSRLQQVARFWAVGMARRAYTRAFKTRLKYRV